MWFAILGVVFIIAIAGIVYLTHCIGRFQAIQKIADGRKWLQYLMSAAIIFAGLFLFAMLLSTVNAVVILLHLMAFFLLAGVLVHLVKPLKKSAIYWQGWIALLATTVTLCAGYYLCNHVWVKTYDLTTEKNIEANVSATPGGLRLAMFSDSHLGTTFDGEGFAQHLKNMETEGADILLIPGDFVDDWSTKEDMLVAAEALGEADFPYGIYFSYGNHDPGHFNDRGFTQEELEEALKENGVHVLKDEAKLIDDRFYVIGRQDATSRDRASMEELTTGLDTGKYMILLDHQPNHYEEEAGMVDLVLSGHTHGGNLFPIGITGVLTHQYDRAYGYEKREGTEFIVTSGISDWALQFKTGTKSEYVIIQINQT